MAPTTAFSRDDRPLNVAGRVDPEFAPEFAGEALEEAAARVPAFAPGKSGVEPVTAKTAEEYGMKVDIMPQDYTIPALVDAMVEYYKVKS